MTAVCTALGFIQALFFGGGTPLQKSFGQV